MIWPLTPLPTWYIYSPPIFLPFLPFFSFFAQKMLKRQILTIILSVQHLNAGPNIQHLRIRFVRLGKYKSILAHSSLKNPLAKLLLQLNFVTDMVYSRTAEIATQHLLRQGSLFTLRIFQPSTSWNWSSPELVRHPRQTGPRGSAPEGCRPPRPRRRLWSCRDHLWASTVDCFSCKTMEGSQPHQEELNTGVCSLHWAPNQSGTQPYI